MASAGASPGPVNAMSIDVEDYFQVAAFARQIDRSRWDTMPCRVERNVALILDLFDRHDTRATFFTLGWIAERYPAVVREIVARGHELASHGYGHLRANDQTPAAFREDLVRAKQILEDIGGVSVNGYRAPSFSIGADNLWAHDVIAETGHQYSSSVYPIAHDHYGMPEAPRFPWRTPSGLVEIPPSSLRLLGRNLPASGGGYFRLLPYTVSRWGIRRINEREGQACIFYFHPWEVDAKQPRVEDASAKSRFRHYVNLERMVGRLDRLLGDFHWDRVDRVFADWFEHVGAPLRRTATAIPA
jgi:polysaccharide deacetylase family protein (PEP-CTERM system associated)